MRFNADPILKEYVCSRDPEHRNFNDFGINPTVAGILDFFCEIHKFIRVDWDFDSLEITGFLDDGKPWVEYEYTENSVAKESFYALRYILMHHIDFQKESFTFWLPED